MDGVEHSQYRATNTVTEMMEIENLFRYTALAVGLMEIENLFRYTALAVGLKPSASQGEARLRGLYRIIYSKTIISVAAWRVRFRECSASFTRFNLV